MSPRLKTKIPLTKFRKQKFLLNLIFLLLILSPAASLSAQPPAPGPVANKAEPDIPLKQICAQNKIPYPLKHPRLEVAKTERKIRLYNAGALLKTYPIALGFAPEGPKEKSGDGKTPEGQYYLIKHSSSGFGKCFYIAYPNTADADKALAQRRITRNQRDSIAAAIRKHSYPPNNTPLGGLILLHGTKDRASGNLTSADWTLGCVAMENAHILDLLPAIPDNARPVIVINK